MDQDGDQDRDQDQGEDHRLPGALPWRLVAAVLAMLGALLAEALMLHPSLTRSFVLLQDRWLLLTELAVMVLALGSLRAWPGRGMRSLDLTGRQVAAIGATVVLVCYAGHYLVLAGYDLSRDEQMADFDRMVYAGGHLAWPIPAAWRGDASALNLLFMLPVARPVAWVSGYLPGNSLLRACVGLVADPPLTGPLLTGGAVLLLWGVARRLWPSSSAADRESATVAVVLMVLSGQTLMMGMTAYAMPAHLFGNLLWLWLFLGDRRRSDVVALIVSFAATGIHQPLFHPLFVAPWLWLLLRERRWGRLTLFVAGYGAICVFWLAYPHFTHLLVAGAGSVTEPTGTSFLSRLSDVLKQNGDNLALTAGNLLRFCVWQNVLLLPLLFAGWMAARKVGPAGASEHDDKNWEPDFVDTSRDNKSLEHEIASTKRLHALAAGLVAPMVLMALILPYQGHGFGYRYLHGLLGNAALLGACGWRELVARYGSLRPLLVRAAAGMVLVILPMQAVMAHRLFAPFAAASAAISNSGADYAVIGADDGPYALDLVLNRPDLGNRPIRLSAGDIDDVDELAHRICHKGVTIALPQDSFFAGMAAEFQVSTGITASKRFTEQANEFGDAGCRVIVLR